MSKHRRTVVILGALCVVVAAAILIVKDHPAWRQHRIAAALEDVPGIASATVSDLMHWPDVVLDGDMEPLEVEAAMKAGLEVVERSEIENVGLWGSFRQMELALDDPADSKLCVAGAVIASHPSVTSGNVNATKINLHVDDDVTPVAEHVFEWARSAEPDPEMLLDIYSKTSFTFETSLGQAKKTDLTPLAEIEVLDTEHEPTQVGLWPPDGKTKMTATVKINEAEPMAAAYETARDYSPLAPTVETRIEVDRQSSQGALMIRVNEPDVSDVRPFIDDMATVGSTVTYLFSGHDLAEIALPSPAPSGDEADTQHDLVTDEVVASFKKSTRRIDARWRSLQRVTIGVNGVALVQDIRGDRLAEYASMLAALWDAGFGSAILDANLGGDRVAMLNIVLQSGTSIDALAPTLRGAGFPGRLRISVSDDRDDNDMGPTLVTFETTDTSRASHDTVEREPNSPDADKILEAWDASAP